MSADAQEIMGSTLRVDLILLPDLTTLHIELQCCRPEDELVATPPQIHDCDFRLMSWVHGSSCMSYIDEGSIQQMRGRLRRELSARPSSWLPSWESELYTRIVTALLEHVTTDANFRRVHAAALQLDVDERADTPDVRFHPDELRDYLARVRIKDMARYTTEELEAELKRRKKAEG